jgi:Rod binding domain-containing protein
MSDLRTPALSPVGAMPAAASTAHTTAPSTAPSPKLVTAAHEFEASMMKELMGPLVSGDDSLDGDSEDSASALTSFAGEALGKAISEQGGFGIATKILHQLSTAGNHSGKTVVPGRKSGITLNSPSK